MSEAPAVRRPARRVLSAVLAHPWAIEPSWLDVIAAIAARETDAPALQAVAARRDGPLQNTATMTVRDGVAVLPVMGPILPRANILQAVSGATTVANMAADFQAALDDPSVRAIVLEIDSPGGAVSGIGEFAAQVAAARGKKPVVAYTSGMAASAAYWIASAADRVVLAPSAVVGSIGVVAGGGYQESPDLDGYRHVEVVSSNAEDKRMNLGTDEGRAKLRGVLDQIESVFVADVARNRGVSVDKVLSDFGRGGLKTGAQAVAAGMADAIGTFEGLLAELAAASPAGGVPQQPAAAAAAMEQSMSKETTTAAAPPVETILADHPAIAAHFRKEGADGERARILGVQEMLVAGHEDLVAGFVADGKTTPAEAALAIVKAAKGQGATALAALQNGFKGNAVGTTASATGERTETPKTPEQEWDACAEGQGVKAEFGALRDADGGKAAFLAHRKAVAEGRVRA